MNRKVCIKIRHIGIAPSGNRLRCIKFIAGCGLAGLVLALGLPKLNEMPRAAETLKDRQSLLSTNSFPCSAYNAFDAPHVWDRLADAGFQFLGPDYAQAVHAPDPDAGFGIIQHLRFAPELIDGIEKPTARQQIAALIETQVRAADAFPIAAWALHPDELRWWRRNEMLFLEHVHQMIRVLDPRARPLWVYEANHRTVDDLIKTGRHQDIVVKSLYTNYGGHARSRAWVYSSGRDMAAASSALKHTIGPFAVLEMFEDPPDDLLFKVPQLVRHDIYAALLAGVRGFILYTFRPRTEYAAREPYLASYLTELQKICADGNIGRIFLEGERLQPLPFLVVSGASTQRIKNRAAKDVPAVHTVSLKHDGTTHHFFVNSSLSPVRIKLDLSMSSADANMTGDGHRSRDGMDDLIWLDGLGVVILSE